MLDPTRVPDDAVERGAYVLRDGRPPDGGEPDVVLLATGSEVHPALGAAELLEQEGVATRVVSMPCLDRFAEQERAYRDAVLPPACRARVAVEAASPLGWHRWIGDGGEVIGMTTFGASGPYTDLYEHFGFTPERVRERGKAVVDAVGAAAS